MAESCRPGLRELFEKKPAAFEKKLCGPPLRGVSRERHSLWPICHEIPAENCAQCRWMAFGQKWTKAYGTVSHTVSGRHVEAFSWLCERSPERGAVWGLGCAACANLRWRLLHSAARPAGAARPAAKIRNVGGLRCDTKWARFQVTHCSRIQAWAVVQHAQSAVHKIAMHVFLRPALPLARILEDEDLVADASLQRGAVPPPEHWLRAWRFVRTPTSFRGAEAILGTESFIAHLRTGQTRESVGRKTLAKSIACMSAVIRARTIETLLAARSITIALDDRGPYRVLRYRCDAAAAARPLPPASRLRSSGGVSPESAGHAALPYRDGILGAICTAAKQDEGLEVLDDDYSQRMHDSVVSCMEKLFGVSEAGADRTQFRAVLGKVRTFLGDGASSVQKCGALLKASVCRNIVLVLRDPVHAMRTSTSEPLKRHGDFQAFWEEIFDKRHALVPDVQHSDAWQRRLVLAQQHVLKVSGRQGGGLACPLRHLSFAKQRFDSATGPARKFCCLLSAIVIMLASLSADWRVSAEQRKRAQQLLDDMTPARIVTAGLFADYTAECSRFFRQFETTDHDVALSSAHKQAFLKRVKALFVDGFVIADVPAAGEGEPGVAASPQEETCTSIVVSQAMAFGTMEYGDRTVTLWPSGAREAWDAAGSQMKEIVETAMDRVEAEMPDADLVIAFSVFNLQTWRKIHRARRVPANRERVEQAMAVQQTRCGRLATAMTCIADVHAVVSSFCTVAEALSRELPAGMSCEDGTASPEQFDNRCLWSRALARGDCEGELPHLVSWYLSVLDNTGVVERDLGKLLSSHQAHLGCSPEVLEDVLLVYLEGPEREEELVTSAVLEPPPPAAGPGHSGDGAGPSAAVERALAPGREHEFRLTPFTRSCTREWQNRHGRRFHLQPVHSGESERPKAGPGRAKKGQNLPKVGTDAAVARGQKRALDARVAAARGPGATSLRTILGAAPGWKSAACPQTKKFQDFKEKTVKKKQAALARQRRRRAGQEPYPVQPLRKNHVFSGKEPEASPPVEACPKLVLYLNLTGAELRCKGAGYCEEDSARRHRVHLLVVPKLAALETCPQTTEFLAAMLTAVAYGLSIVDRPTWEREAHPYACDKCLRYIPAVDRVPATLVMTEEFAAKHKLFAQILRTACDRPGSQWKQAAAASPQNAKTHRLDCVADVAKFIRRVRRLRRQTKHVGGTLFPAGSTAQSSKPAAKSKAAGKKSLHQLFSTPNSLRGLFSSV